MSIDTEAGGATWAQQDKGLSDVNRWEGLYFLNTNNGWVVGNNGTIIHTDTGGE